MASHDFHNTHSNTYDRMASRATINIASQFLPTLTPPISANSRILDNACGTGIVSALIKASHPDAPIVGADLAPAVLEIYRSKAQQGKWENVETKVLDVRDLKGLEDSSFSHVITNFGLGADSSDLSGPGKAAREMWRVCEPGGVAVVTSWLERNFPIAFHAAALRIRPDEEPFSWKQPAEWATAAWLEQILLSAGFGKVEVKSVNGQMEAESLDQLVENLLLFKDMFYKDYTEEEVHKLPGILKDEVRALEAYEEGDWGVRIKMVAWVGMAWK